MIVPKLYRWLFFKRSRVSNAFDAIRNPKSIFVDASLYLTPKPELRKDSLKLGKENLQEFIEMRDVEATYILFGNNKEQLNFIHDALENAGFSKIFNVGTREDLERILEEENRSKG